MCKINSRISVDPHCTREMIISRMRVVNAPSTDGYRLLTRKCATSLAAGLPQPSCWTCCSSAPANFNKPVRRYKVAMAPCVSALRLTAAAH